MKRPPSIRDLEKHAEYERGLSELGALRASLLNELEQVDIRARKLVFDAAESGLPYRRIGEFIGITSGSVSKWISKSRLEK